MQDSKKDTTKEAPRSSQLSKGRERFLAHVIEHGLECGQRTPEDFIRHFPPMAIMKALEDQPDLRANIVVIATGVKKKVALKKTAEHCGMDVQIALDETARQFAVIKLAFTAAIQNDLMLAQRLQVAKVAATNRAKASDQELHYQSGFCS